MNYQVITKTFREHENVLYVSEKERNEIINSIGDGLKCHYLSRVDLTVNIVYGADIIQAPNKKILLNSRAYFEEKIRSSKDEEEKKSLIKKANQMYKDFSISLENK